MKSLITVLLLLTTRVTADVDTTIKERKATAVLYENSSSKGASAALKMVGYVEFSQKGPKATLSVSINIFTNEAFADGLHGFHIHNFGNVYGGCTSTQGHFNPLDKNHGGQDSEVRHIGDFGNIDILNHQYTGELSDTHASLYGQYSIIGRGVVLHEGEDDLGLGSDVSSTKTGNAGPRLACGVIAVNSEGFDSSSIHLTSSMGLILSITILRFLFQ